MKILFYTNILTPYRAFFFKSLNDNGNISGDEIKILVMADSENGRQWKYNDYNLNFVELLTSKTICFGGIEIHINSKLASIIRKYKPDLVICGGGYIHPGTWLLSKRKRLYKCLFWSESHLNESRSYSKFRLWFREKIRRLFFKRFDGFCYAGQMSLQLINRYSLPNSSKIFLPNLVDGHKYETAMTLRENSGVYRKKFNLGEKRIIICPARIIKVKGIDRFLDLYRLCDNRNKWKLVIAGEGSERNIIEQMIEKYALDVVLLGEKTQEEIIELYSLANLFLLPSISDANPLSCIEALWAGLPLLVSTNVGNYIEVVEQNHNGAFFSYDDSNAVHIIDSILSKSDEWYLSAGEKSHAIAVNAFSVSSNTSRIIKEFKEII